MFCTRLTFRARFAFYRFQVGTLSADCQALRTLAQVLIALSIFAVALSLFASLRARFAKRVLSNLPCLFRVPLLSCQEQPFFG